MRLGNRESFIIKAMEVHGEKYDYSLVVYKSSQEKIKIKCPDHGIFEQAPSKHLFGQGCPRCAQRLKKYPKLKKYATEFFIQRAKEIHGNKYDYSVTDYTGSRLKVKIICPKHGLYKQTPYFHLKGRGCFRCGVRKRSNEDFITEAKEKHGNKYDYSLTRYTAAKSKIKIICPKHGVFEQRAESHLVYGCRKCAGENVGWNRLSREDFIMESEKIHGNKYDYSLVKYKNRLSPVKILCPKHGAFEQMPGNHMCGRGCQKCATEIISLKKTKSVDTFIKDALCVHGDIYDYSQVDYTGCFKRIKIVCSVHGTFEQTPNAHLQGEGCPYCLDSYGERKISSFLDSLNILYCRQKKFDHCRNVRVLPFDFYLPNFEMCIEYDGIQHFVPIPYWGGTESFEYRKKLDAIKSNFCKVNEINLVRISYKEEDKIESILEKLLKPSMQV
jgi:hypothetical protein